MARIESKETSWNTISTLFFKHPSQYYLDSVFSLGTRSLEIRAWSSLVARKGDGGRAEQEKSQRSRCTKKQGRTEVSELVAGPDRRGA